MIIKSKRVLTSDANRIAAYLSESGDNESVTWVKGRQQNLPLMDEISKLSGSLFSIRHVIIAPECAMSHADLAIILDEYAQEYTIPDLSVQLACIVLHHKKRLAGAASPFHWHVCLPEVDASTRRVLDSKFTRIPVLHLGEEG